MAYGRAFIDLVLAAYLPICVIIYLYGVQVQVIQGGRAGARERALARRKIKVCIGFVLYATPQEKVSAVGIVKPRSKTVPSDWHVCQAMLYSFREKSVVREPSGN